MITQRAAVALFTSVASAAAVGLGAGLATAGGSTPEDPPYTKVVEMKEFDYPAARGGTVEARCPEGFHITGGGYWFDGLTDLVYSWIAYNSPTDDNKGWTISWRGGGNDSAKIKAHSYALCAKDSTR